MEPLKEKKENFFEKYEYLEKLLKNYRYPIDRNSLNMQGYLMLIHRMIFLFQNNSKIKLVKEVEEMFFILIENSIKMDKNTILFKTLTYFIQKGFDLFIATLKSKEVISENEFIQKLLNVLDLKDIAKSFDLNEIDIERELNISIFKKVIIKKKLKFVNIIFSFPLFFLNKFIHENSAGIKDKIIAKTNENYINKFYKTFKEAILDKKYDTLKKIINSESSEEKKAIKNPKSNEELEKSESNKEKEIKNETMVDSIKINEENENADKNETKQNSDNSSYKEKEKDKTEKIEDYYKSEQTIIDPNEKFSKLNEDENTNNTKENKIYSNEEIMKMLKSLKEENKKLNQKLEEENKKLNQKLEEQNKKLNQKFEEENNKLSQKFEEENNKLKEEINGLKDKVIFLNEKLDLAILINNLGTQRDTYKASIEIMLKYLNNELDLNIILKDDDEIWKKTKYISEKILKSGKMEKQYLKKIVGSLNALLFCKDYSNCLIHGKGKFSEEIKGYYESSKDTPIISLASYENMKNVTKGFFGGKVNESKVFGIINSLLFSKIEKWKENEIDYSEYLSDGSLNCENIMNDFDIAVKIMEYYKLNEKIDASLEK